MLVAASADRRRRGLNTRREILECVMLSPPFVVGIQATHKRGTTGGLPAAVQRVVGSTFFLARALRAARPTTEE